MLITLEPHGIFGSNFVCSCVLHCPVNGMKKGDKASPSIILAGQVLLVKMLLTLEPCCVFGSNFEYLCIFNTVQLLVCKS